MRSEVDISKRGVLRRDFLPRSPGKALIKPDFASQKYFKFLLSDIIILQKVVLNCIHILYSLTVERL